MLSHEEVDEGLRKLMVDKLDNAQTGDEETVLIGGTRRKTSLCEAGADAPGGAARQHHPAQGHRHERQRRAHRAVRRNQGLVRFRVDGVLQEGLQIPKARLPAVTARIKVMSRLNLAESRLPQDGRIKVKAGDHLIDLRVSTLPTLFGERVVLRLLRAGQLISLAEIGLWPGNDFQRAQRSCRSTHTD